MDSFKMITKMPKQKNKSEFSKSSLMINPTQQKHLDKLGVLNADIAVINLEDGIAPQKKEEALFAASDAISKLKESKAKIAVRTNHMDSPYFDKELEVLNALSPDAIRVPKIRSVEDVLRLEMLIEQDIEIHLSIETKEALASLSRLKTSDRVTTVFLGAIDLLEDLGLGSHLIDSFSDTLKYIMCKFLVDAKTVGFRPFSFVYQNHIDIDGFKKWIEIEKNLGFEAKACISPTQVSIVNEAFAPSKEAIEEALRVKELFEINEQNGIGGFCDDKLGFIDAPIYKNAILTLKKGAVL